MRQLVMGLREGLGGTRAGTGESLNGRRQMSRMDAQMRRRLGRGRAWVQERSNVRRQSLAEPGHELGGELALEHLQDDLRVFHREAGADTLAPLGFGVEGVETAHDSGGRSLHEARELCR